MINQRTAILLLLLSVLFAAISFQIGSDIASSTTRIRNISQGVNDTTTSRRLALVNRAVKEQQDTTFFSYTGNFETPFKKWNEKPVVRSNSKSSVPPRAMLSLKGILIKKRPLAILDNGQGETQIRSEGERAFDQTVISISNNHVTLRDHLGTYEIAVEEN